MQQVSYQLRLSREAGCSAGNSGSRTRCRSAAGDAQGRPRGERSVSPSPLAAQSAVRGLSVLCVRNRHDGSDRSDVGSAWGVDVNVNELLVRLLYPSLRAAKPARGDSLVAVPPATWVACPEYTRTWLQIRNFYATLVNSGFVKVRCCELIRVQLA